jgi:exodeoxyribonuclease VII small subunit
MTKATWFSPMKNWREKSPCWQCKKTKAGLLIPAIQKFNRVGRLKPNNLALPGALQAGRKDLFGLASVLVANSTKTAGGHSAKTPPFEEALKKLEGIVEAMESDDLPLETLLTKYEEGSKLVKVCQEKLADAELKIQQLEKTAAGEMKLKSFENVEE